MEPQLPIKREEHFDERSEEENPSNMLSFLTVPTDSQSAASGRNHGGAQTTSMNYTESQSAGQPGEAYANQENDAREQVIEEETRRETVKPSRKKKTVTNGQGEP